ncbi:MAG: hypothetical protein HDR14_07445 [Lachnospiraceae bacterium]|nr:hypothetical protein [Lachnospiraceae bacterium]
MKHIFKRTVTVALITSLLLSVCASAKRTYSFSKENPKASVWLFANDNDPKDHKKG